MQITEITEFEDSRLDIYTKFKEVQLLRYFEPAEGVFVAESPMIIERALDAGYEPLSLLMERRYITGQGKELLERIGDVPVYVADLDVMTKLTGYQITRGVLCAIRRKPLPTVADVCENARRIVVLEDVMNPTNVGAIFRSAAALGMDGIVLTAGCADPLYRRASRVAMGTTFQIPWTALPKHESWDSTCLELKSFGYKFVAMALRDDSISIDDEVLHREPKLAIVMGTEGDGLRPETISACDYTVRIPMSHNVDSLNVAAASAVAFWELSK